MLVWDLVKGLLLHRFRAHPGPVMAIECGGDRSTIITSGTDGYVKIWDPSMKGSGLVAKIPVFVDGGVTCVPPLSTGVRGLNLYPFSNCLYICIYMYTYT